MYKPLSIFILLLLLGSALHAQDKDVEGSEDHPMFTRVPGSTIIKYDFKEFDEAVLPLSKYLTLKRAFTKTKRVEGAVYRIGYKIPAGRSTLEVMRSYEDALAKGDAKILFECSGSSACGNAFDSGLDDQPGEEDLFGSEVVEEDSQRYLAARMDKHSGAIYVIVYAYHQYDTEKPYVRFRVIETEAQQEQLITLNADAIKQALDNTGHIAVEGIYFDTNKATLRYESAPVLQEMATVLNNNPDLHVYVVGHTDDTGELDYNMELSSRRAKAVADYLTGKLDVNANQVEAHGAGPLAPVAANSLEKGRQQNRRVEMVKKIRKE